MGKERGEKNIYFLHVFMPAKEETESTPSLEDR